ncbi:MAG: YaiI/YqxD family protein [Planctomycetales bacterium]|nr:YaiI/YqxD family protein [Planctomycetales bacterium]
MKIWIDADAAPREVKEVVFRAARRLQIETIMVANQPLALPPHSPTVSMVAVREGANIADRYIVTHSQPGDLVITADIPLAADLVAKDVAVIDPRGDEHTADNIKSRLSLRDFLDVMRGAGTLTGGNNPFDARDKKRFAAALDRFLAKS